jgi:hypothetical protein
MSKHREAIEKNLQGTPIRAAGEAMGMAVAITDEDLVTGKAKLFGAKVQRFPLRTISNIRTIPNPSANVLEIAFATTPPSSVMVMYGSEAQRDFDDIIAMLKSYVQVPS